MVAFSSRVDKNLFLIKCKVFWLTYEYVFTKKNIFTFFTLDVFVKEVTK